MHHVGAARVREQRAGDGPDGLRPKGRLIPLTEVHALDDEAYAAALCGRTGPLFRIPDLAWEHSGLQLRCASCVDLAPCD
ncbi:MAG: hypothetical protein M3Z02_00460 [Actinomycetota bacterium]|nr:hypothetical protein [Actinomycetota bacterium]